MLWKIYTKQSGILKEKYKTSKMTDEQLTQLSIQELSHLLTIATEARLKAERQNNFILHADHGHTILKCQQLLEFKNNH